jgi:hypothetical protein
VVGVGARHCQRVIENTRGFLKRESVLGQVLAALAGSHSKCIPWF